MSKSLLEVTFERFFYAFFPSCGGNESNPLRLFYFIDVEYYSPFGTLNLGLGWMLFF